MTIQIKKATREAVPILAGLAGYSGSGKTFSALLLAAGLAGKEGKIGLIDTDNKRASMYATDPKIMAAIPQGYDVADMTDPYTPARFLEYAREFEGQGYDVLVIDTISHEYEGTGGMEDMAATSKTKWLAPKMQHKKMMNGLLALNMHIIFCIRAREKVKVDKKTGEYTDMGVQPICEKNFMFELTLSMMLDSETNLPKVIKKPPTELVGTFNNSMGLITKSHGERLREWTMGGVPLDPQLEKVKEACREAARLGNKSLDDYLKKVPVHLKSQLMPFGGEFRSIAENIDSLAAIVKEQESDSDFEHSKLG